MQWLRSRKWLTYIICMKGVAIFLFMAYHFALAGNRDEAGNWFLLAICTFMPSSTLILYAIFDGVRERRAGLEWIYLHDGSAVLVSKIMAEELKKELKKEFEQNGELRTFDWVVCDRYRLIEENKNLI